jgi:hypothetical protein
MSRKTRFHFTVFACCLYLSGCVEAPSIHRPITDAAVRQIVRGQTTGDQILALFGTPYRKLIPPNHLSETWQYIYINPQMMDRRFLMVLLRDNVVVNYAYSGPPIGPVTQEGLAKLMNPYGLPTPAVQPIYNNPATVARPPSTSSTLDPARQETIDRVAEALVAAAAKIWSRPGESDSRFKSVARSRVSALADQHLDSFFEELFPDKPLVREVVAKSVEAILGGEFTVKNVAEETAKDEIYQWVAERSPEAANDLEVAYFLYDVYKRWYAH